MTIYYVIIVIDQGFGQGSVETVFSVIVRLRAEFLCTLIHSYLAVVFWMGPQFVFTWVFLLGRFGLHSLVAGF